MDWPVHNPSYALECSGAGYGRHFGLRDGKVASERLAL
jgi:hypothetical protein